MDHVEPYHGQDRPERQRAVTVPLYPVIVGYDGSASSRNAVAYAAGMAKRRDRPLLGAFINSAPGVATAFGVPAIRDPEAVERWLLAELDDVGCPVGLRVHVRTRWGSPARELSALAAELSAEALVLGAPARSWRRAAGSVPGWLATHAPCPVIVVP